LLDRSWHSRHGHQRARHLVEKLVGVFLFGQRRIEQRDDGGVPKLLGQIPRGRIARYFVVLDALRRSDQGEVRCGVMEVSEASG